MYPHFLALPLPTRIKASLASLRYGLPSIRWVEEENFHLVLRYFGPLSDLVVAQIKDCLHDLFFLSFPISLKGIGQFHSKGSKGSIWVGVEENSALQALKKEINSLLKNLILPPEEHPFHPHITLGRYERMNFQKFENYLSAFSSFQSQSFEVQHCQLIRSHQTPKHTHYQTVIQIDASQLSTGDD